MDENGICEQSYYQWQRKFRQKVYEEMRKSSDAVPAVAEKSELSFFEIPYCSSAKKNGQMISGSVVAVIGFNCYQFSCSADVISYYFCYCNVCCFHIGIRPDIEKQRNVRWGHGFYCFDRGASNWYWKAT